MTLILKRPVIAVAGSAGKTTTKEMIASILRQRWKIYKSAANLNNRHDIKHHVRRIRPSHRAIVLEFGMSARGHLTRSCSIIKPNMAVITTVGTAHIGNVGGSLTNLIRAKSELIRHMKQSGSLFLNADDINSRLLFTRKFPGKIIRVGIISPADFQASHVTYTQEGMTFRVALDETECDFFIPILGTHNVYNALLAIAVSHSLGFNPEEIRQGLKTYNRPLRRLRIYKLKQDVRIIDDTFNANPHSVKAALDVLTTIGEGDNIAVLASMAELGRYSQKGHAEVGKYLASKTNLTRLFTYGKDAWKIARAAIKNGFPPEKVTHSRMRGTLHKRLENCAEPGSTILVKGSHNMNMNKTVRFLRHIARNRD